MLAIWLMAMHPSPSLHHSAWALSTRLGLQPPPGTGPSHPGDAVVATAACETPLGYGTGWLNYWGGLEESEILCSWVAATHFDF